jgi:hypothetical protein
MTRARRDRAKARIAARTDQSGHPLRAEVTVRVLGRKTLGRAAPRTFRFGIDLLLGQASEHELLRQISDALTATYYSDIHMAQRSRVLARMEARCDPTPLVVGRRTA